MRRYLSQATLLRAPLLVALLPALCAAAPVVTRMTAGGQPVVVVVRPGEGTGPWPVVYLLAGMTELSGGPKVSAAAWVDRYRLPEALAAIEAGRLERATFQNLVDGRLLAAYRARRARGYAGLVLVGVPAPVVYTEAFERYVVETLVPWAEKALPVKPGAAFRGIDGVSLGGQHALRLAFRHPDGFRSVGTEQAAVRGLADRLARLARAHLPAARRLRINLLTSRGDPYLRPIRALAATLRRLGLHVRHGVVIGPHDYPFNAGPAAIDLLLFHDAVLNGTCAPEPFPIQP